MSAAEIVARLVWGAEAFRGNDDDDGDDNDDDDQECAAVFSEAVEELEQADAAAVEPTEPTPELQAHTTQAQELPEQLDSDKSVAGSDADSELGDDERELDAGREHLTSVNAGDDEDAQATTDPLAVLVSRISADVDAAPAAPARKKRRTADQMLLDGLNDGKELKRKERRGRDTALRLCRNMSRRNRRLQKRRVLAAMIVYARDRFEVKLGKETLKYLEKHIDDDQRDCSASSSDEGSVGSLADFVARDDEDAADDPIRAALQQLKGMVSKCKDEDETEQADVDPATAMTEELLTLQVQRDRRVEADLQAGEAFDAEFAERFPRTGVWTERHLHLDEQARGGIDADEYQTFLEDFYEMQTPPWTVTTDDVALFGFIVQCYLDMRHTDAQLVTAFRSNRELRTLVSTRGQRFEDLQEINDDDEGKADADEAPEILQIAETEDPNFVVDDDAPLEANTVEDENNDASSAPTTPTNSEQESSSSSADEADVVDDAGGEESDPENIHSSASSDSE